MYKCFSCEKCFYSQWRKYGHERIHGRGSRREEHISDFVHWDDLGNEENYVPTESLPIGEESDLNFEVFHEKYMEYLNIQRLTLSPGLIELLEAGYPTLMDKTRKEKANIRCYFEIADCFNSLDNLSVPKKNSILEMMRLVTYMNGKEIPLPVRYSTIIDNILKKTKPIKSRIMKKEFVLSEALFGPDIALRLPVQHGVVTDLVKVMSKCTFHVYTTYFAYVLTYL
jgi:hypothetical protein